MNQGIRPRLALRCGWHRFPALTTIGSRGKSAGGLAQSKTLARWQ
jgi:hypothetical protein